MDNHKLIGKIIGGGNVENNESYPFMATFWYLDGMHFKYKAGAIWIGKNYFLTAAHCILKRDIRMIIIKMGDKNLDNQTLEFRVTTIIMHPNFNSGTLENDIAILETDNSPTSIFPHLIPVILPNLSYNIQYKPNNCLKILGYGRDKALVNSFERKHLTELKEVTVNIIPINKTGYKKLGTNVFLAGNVINGVIIDSCIGDSGGPCIKLINDRWVLIGIISCGIGCGDIKYPGIYTKVQPYYTWIYKYCKLL